VPTSAWRPAAGALKACLRRSSRSAALDGLSPIDAHWNRILMDQPWLCAHYR